MLAVRGFDNLAKRNRFLGWAGIFLKTEKSAYPYPLARINLPLNDTAKDPPGMSCFSMNFIVALSKLSRPGRASPLAGAAADLGDQMKKTEKKTIQNMGIILSLMDFFLDSLDLIEQFLFLHDSLGFEQVY